VAHAPGPQDAGWHDPTGFERVLAETVSWCAGRASLGDPAGSLRTPALRPSNLNVIPNEHGHHEYRWGTDSENARVVRSVVRRRRELLRRYGGCPWDGNHPLGGGRLLVFDPGRSDYCAVSGPESRFVIDWLDAPPWDAWLLWVSEKATPLDDAVAETRRLYVQAYGAGRPPWNPPERVSCLLSWVPAVFLELVEAAIDLNPTECLFWATDYRQQHYNTRLFRWLDAAGLLTAG